MKERKDKKHVREFGNWSQDKNFFTCLNKWSRASGTSKMNIETLKKYDKKKITMIITFIVLAFIVILCGLSLAKYRNSKSISIAKGTINYKQPDLDLVSVYLEDSDNNYKQASDGKIPASGYTLNEDITKTRCTIKGEVDNNIKITYENGEVSFTRLTMAGTKCYLYFDKIKDTEAPVIGKSEARNVEKTSMDLYVEASDNIGITGYYFKLSTDSDWGEAKCVGATSCTLPLTGLTPDTSYTYNIKVCDGGDNCPTTTITQKTKADGIKTSEIIVGGTTTSDSMFSGTSGDGVYTWTKGDYSGGSQTIKYFRGNVNSNWVVFGKDGNNYIWWRIIRNNSNGSIRMIYAGVSSSKTSAPATTGSGTQIGTKAFNTTANDNMYVGFKYTSGEVHGTGTNSTILGETTSTDKTTLYGWYNATLAKSTTYSERIDLTAGFCNDRGPSTDSSSLNGSGGTGTTRTYYAAYIRLVTNKAPSLLCASTSDIFKTPVGLITADEVSMAGIGYGYSLANTSSYLYTNSHYWTMSPYEAGGAGMFFVSNMLTASFIKWNDDTGVSSTENADQPYGVRPVINLKSSTLFEKNGNGTSTNPYIVIGT